MSGPRSPSTASRRGASALAVEAALEEALAGAGAPDVVSAYLFGSVAEERAHRESDVDLGVLLAWESHPRAADRFDVRLRLMGAVQAALGRRVDLVVLNDAPPLLGRHVVTRGRRVLCRDAETDHRYVCDVQLRAADLEPWLRRMRAIKFRALRA